MDDQTVDPRVQINWPETSESDELLEEGTRNVKFGLGVGAFGAGSLALIGATCPLCFVVAPAMVGVGLWKRRKAKCQGEGVETYRSRYDPNNGSEAMSEDFWDEKFDVDGYRYGTRPNAFLEERAPRDIPPGGHVLCLGAGEGRNPVWLAEQGFEVSALDQSGVGLGKLRERAAQRGVDVETIKSSIEAWTPAPDRFDAVVMTYFHLPPGVRGQTHQKAIAALAPGGVIIVEAFTPAQIQNERTSGGPPAIELMYTAELLRADFSPLDIELLREETVELDEGPGHRGPGDVVRLVARKRK